MLAGERARGGTSRVIAFDHDFTSREIPGMASCASGGSAASFPLRLRFPFREAFALGGMPARRPATANADFGVVTKMSRDAKWERADQTTRTRGVPRSDGRRPERRSNDSSFFPRLAA